MVNSISSHIIALFLLSSLLGINGKQPAYRTQSHNRQTTTTKEHGFEKRLRNDPNALQQASNDYGNIIHEKPTSVLYPASANDIIKLIDYSIRKSRPPTIAARGNGHSVWGQAMARESGVVIDMSSLGKNGNSHRIKVYKNNLSRRYYADVGSEQLWIEVLQATLKQGLAPVSWTDSLYLTVGGTLSNAGIGGQTFLHGPQISNVFELDVITGKAEHRTCSKSKNHELFFGVLGGLGQFGIITRARILLNKAPTRVRWVRLLYTNFTMFIRDQEHLIASKSPNFVEGFIITNGNRTTISSLMKNRSLLYSIELAKYYDNTTSKTIEKEFGAFLRELKPDVPKFVFKKDVPFIDFLNRVGNLERKPSQAHPWLNLFIPKSRIMDFHANVLVKMMPKLRRATGTYSFYPLNRNKWHNRTSAVIPDEDIFYTLGLMHTSRVNDTETFEKFNNEILRLCKQSGIMVKQYLPHYRTWEQWRDHFGSKFAVFVHRKRTFDPRNILSPGHRIFGKVH